MKSTMRLFLQRLLTSLVLLVCFYVAANASEACLFSNLDSCMFDRGSDDASSPSCRCPCLPKCCPAGYKVAKIEGGNGLHGLDCVKGEEPLPQVPLIGRLPDCSNVSQSDLRFYHSVFPLCDGMEGGKEDWSYDLHPHGQFVLNADYQQEYVLHVRNGEKQMISNFDNAGDREGLLTAKLGRDTDGGSGNGHKEVVVGFKPLMYFCFDRMETTEGSSETVAVTCPKSPLTTTRKIHKCCPPGHTYSDASLQSCSPRSPDSSAQWFLPINGHLYSEARLEEEGVLAYDAGRALVRREVALECSSRGGGGFDKFEEHDNFHLGPDGKLHFTDTHMDLGAGGLEDFCVDQLYEEPVDYYGGGGDEKDKCGGKDAYEYDPDGDYSHYYDYYEDEANVTDLARSGFGGDGEDDIFTKKMSSYSCHNKELKPHTMVALYCKEKIVYMMKCCDVNQTLNLRARSCSSHVESSWEDPSVYSLRDGLPVPLPNTGGDESGSRLRLLPWNIPNMVGKGRRLYVSSAEFSFLSDGRLFYEGKVYGQDKYCLDNAVDYCGGLPSAELRAIIDDPDLAKATASAIFGTNKEDSLASLIIKRVGYPVSIGFLMVTLAVFLVVPELRKDLHGKMVICIVFSQVVVYICLFIGTFPSYEVSRSNWKCVAQAAFTYYFILCSFGWMSAMSYNIMSKFRASTILPKDADRRRFVVYSCFCFLLPLLPLAAVLATDRSFQHYGKAGQISPEARRLAGFLTDFRPGFGEESCWFTSCSSALSVFLYGPMVVMLLSNAGMFAFAAFKLNKMRKRILDGGGDGGSRRYSSYNSQYSRSLSTGPLMQSVSVTSNNSEDEEDSNAAAAATCETLKKRFVRQMSSISSGITTVLTPQQKRKAKYNANKESLSTYLKLFSAMGLTWAVEILAWCLSGKDNPAPLQVVICLNLLNIFQGIIIFLVFTMKPATAHKLQQRFGKNRTGRARLRENGSGGRMVVGSLRSTNGGGGSVGSMGGNGGSVGSSTYFPSAPSSTTEAGEGVDGDNSEEDENDVNDDPTGGDRRMRRCYPMLSMEDGNGEIDMNHT